MKSQLKIGILLVTLVLPALIYLFLRGYGKNEFTIPVYYSNGLYKVNCASSTGPHYVSFDNYPMLKPHLFYFPQWVTSDSFYKEAARVQNRYPQLVLTGITDTLMTPNLGKVWVVRSKKRLMEIANCDLVWGQDKSINSNDLGNQLVLVDTKKRIRGYYDGGSLEEMDRLIVELDILEHETEK